MTHCASELRGSGCGFHTQLSAGACGCSVDVWEKRWTQEQHRSGGPGFLHAEQPVQDGQGSASLPEPWAAAILLSPDGPAWLGGGTGLIECQ